MKTAGKRQRTAALQNLPEFRAQRYTRSVMECGSPLPLSVRERWLALAPIVWCYDIHLDTFGAGSVGTESFSNSESNFSSRFSIITSCALVFATMILRASAPPRLSVSR